MKLGIILPIYNEKEHIEELIKKLLEIENSEVIIVDDSNDETVKILNNLSKNNSKIHFIHNNKRLGRGGSGIKGFKYAINLDFDNIIEMDGDLSHDPKYISNIISLLENKADVVIGSRFLKGGELKNRGFIRNLITQIAKYYINLSLNLKLTDPTSGFRGFNKNIIKSILPNLKAKDPFIISEVLFFCKKHGFTIKETPIIFNDRSKGKSKLKFSTLITYPFRLLKLKIGLN